MSEFALPIVREEIALTWFSGTASNLKRHARLVGSVLGRAGGTAPIYCYFKRDGRRLSCAFSNAKGILLGESVRDWLTEAYGVQSFVWCQKLGEAYALVLVSGGAVLRDAVFGESELQRELELALNRVDADADGERRLFLHRNVSVAPELDPDCRGETLNVTVNQWIDRLSRSESAAAPELHSLDDFPEVALWNAVWNWTRRVVFVALFAGVAWYGWTWWLALQPDEPVDTGPKGPSEAHREYEKLRLSPDPGVLVPAIHSAYLEFMSDPLFGASWQVTSLRWAAAEADALEIKASLPVLEVQAEEDEAVEIAFQLPGELRRRLITYAGGRDWSLELDGSLATLVVPVELTPRTAAEAERIRLPEPSGQRERWHWRQMTRDLEVVGDTQKGLVREIPSRNPLYRQYGMSLELHGIEWSSRDMAAWLGARLSGGPVVLESIVLQAAQGTASMQGEMRFRMVWCAKVDAATGSCVDAE